MRWREEHTGTEALPASRVRPAAKRMSDPRPNLELTRRVVATEAECIGALARRIDERFAAAAEAVFRCPGSVILTGIGKAGVIAQKISATLGVPELIIREQVHKEPHGYHERGMAVCEILREMSRGRTRALRLLFCGHLMDMWGEPWSWDPKRLTLERLPFPAGGTAAPT